VLVLVVVVRLCVCVFRYDTCDAEGILVYHDMQFAQQVWLRCRVQRVACVCCVLCAVCCVLCAVCCVLCAMCYVLCSVCCVLCAM
jgi:hypothetical protein